MEKAGRGARASPARDHHRHGRQVRRSRRFLQVPQRGARPRRDPRAQQGQHPLRGFGDDREGRRRRAPERRGCDTCSRRVRQARRGRHDEGDPVRAREQGAVSRHMPGHAACGDRVCAQRRRPRGGEQHGIRPRHSAPRDRARDRVAGPRRPDRAPRRKVRSGRDDAPGGSGCRARAREPRAQSLRHGRDQRAPPPPLRGQQPVRAAIEGQGLARFRPYPARATVRDDRVAFASLADRLPVPSRVYVDATYRPSAFRCFRRSRASIPGEQDQDCHRGMKLCGFEAGLDKPLFLIAGPCVVESRQMALDTASALKEICQQLDVPFIYKSSYDKANRSSGKSYRGLGMDKGLEILAEVKKKVGVPVLTDVHDKEDVAEVAAAVDVLQTPAFLCRQTDFIHVVATAGRPVNIKKGQFLSPAEMKNVVEKAREASGKDNILVSERGASFGYNNLVSDMRSLAIMRETGCPVVFDATHSVQLPGGQGISSGGQREFVPVLARAAVASGIAGVFMETHPDPDKALSDGPNAWPLDRMKELLATLKELDALVKRGRFAEQKLKTRKKGA